MKLKQCSMQQQQPNECVFTNSSKLPSKHCCSERGESNRFIYRNVFATALSVASARSLQPPLFERTLCLCSIHLETNKEACVGGLCGTNKKGEEKKRV